jgi:hypothetical protein
MLSRTVATARPQLGGMRFWSVSSSAQRFSPYLDAAQGHLHGHITARKRATPRALLVVFVYAERMGTVDHAQRHPGRPRYATAVGEVKTIYLAEGFALKSSADLAQGDGAMARKYRKIAVLDVPQLRR